MCTIYMCDATYSRAWHDYDDSNVCHVFVTRVTRPIHIYDITKHNHMSLFKSYGYHSPLWIRFTRVTRLIYVYDPTPTVTIRTRVTFHSHV